MTTQKRKRDSDTTAVKAASAQRLVALLEVTHRGGRLKPINSEAKSQTSEIQVKS